MDEKTRKSSRSFELEKGGKRSFDLNKTSARKFDLAKDSDEVGLEELKKELLADGKIDAEEVVKLHEVLYQDGMIDRKEADFLFELNDAVSGKDNDPHWDEFFVQAISGYLLNSEGSHGVIDEENGKWLAQKIGADGQVDGTERKLLNYLKRNAKKMPDSVSALLNGSGSHSGSSVPPEGSTSPDSGGPNSKKWLWILLAIVAAAAIAYFCMKSCEGDKDKQQTELMSSNASGGNDEQITPKDSTVNDTTSEEPSAVDEETSVADEESANDNAKSTGDTGSSDESSASQHSGVINSNNGDSRIPSDESTLSSSSDQHSEPVPPTTERPRQAVTSGSIKDTALDVIRGIYGNGMERKKKLGDAYREVQDLVNEMYRKGLVH